MPSFLPESRVLVLKCNGKIVAKLLEVVAFCHFANTIVKQGIYLQDVSPTISLFFPQPPIIFCVLLIREVGSHHPPPDFALI